MCVGVADALDVNDNVLKREKDCDKLGDKDGDVERVDPVYDGLPVGQKEYVLENERDEEGEMDGEIDSEVDAEGVLGTLWEWVVDAEQVAVSVEEYEVEKDVKDMETDALKEAEEY